MSKELTREEIEKRFSEINALEPDVMTEEEENSLMEAERINDGTTVRLPDYMSKREYSGKLMLRIPRDLHKTLAIEAKENGVSLNQYAVYKLSKA